MERFLARLRGGSKVNANDFGLSVEDVVSYFSGSGQALDIRLELDVEGNASVQSPRRVRMAEVAALVKKSLNEYLESRPEGSRGQVLIHNDFPNDAQVPSHLPDLVWLDSDPTNRFKTGYLSSLQVFEEATFILKFVDSEDKEEMKRVHKALLQCLHHGKAKLGILIDPFSRLTTLFRKIGEQVDMTLNQERWRELDGETVFPGFTLPCSAIDAIQIPGPGVTILRPKSSLRSNNAVLNEDGNSSEINYDVEPDLESVELIVKQESHAETGSDLQEAHDSDQPAPRKRLRRIASRLDPHTPTSSRISESLKFEHIETQGNPEDIPIYANSVRVMFVFPDNDDMDYMWPGMYVPPNDREGTIESTSRTRFAIGSHVESCAPDIPLIRYFEDGSYAALDSAEVHFEFYDPSDFQFETFLTDNEDSKDPAIKLAVHFLNTRELADRLKWPAWKKADEKREIALKEMRKEQRLKSKKVDKSKQKRNSVD